MKEVLLHVKARTALEGLEKKHRDRIATALKGLAEWPDVRHVRKLAGSGSPVLHRLRIGSWRAVFAVDGDEVLVTDLFPRERGYR